MDVEGGVRFSAACFAVDWDWAAAVDGVFGDVAYVFWALGFVADGGVFSGGLGCVFVDGFGVDGWVAVLAGFFEFGFAGSGCFLHGEGLVVGADYVSGAGVVAADAGDDVGDVLAGGSGEDGWGLGSTAAVVDVDGC